MLEVAAIVLIAIAVFAQWRVRAFTSTATRAWITRAFLAALGVGVGYVAVSSLHADPFAVFLAGFGLVHVPPATVLLLKGLRGERPS